MRIEVENTREVQLALTRADARVTAAAKQVQEDFSEDLLERLKQTSPVDTGRYKGAWRIERGRDAMYVVNDTPYAKYLVFPNSRMVGSRKADLPSEGILHNARGIIFNKRDDYQKSMIKRIQQVLATSGTD